MAEFRTESFHFMTPRRNFRLAVYIIFCLVIQLLWTREIRLDDRDGGQAVTKFLQENPAPPRPSQKNIEIALAVFKIRLSKNCHMPVFDPTLTARGETHVGGLLWKGDVFIGPSAFASWGLLGSSLAHEIEVHCQQNHLLYTVMDAFNLDGEKVAEEEAYGYELYNSARFGLTEAEIQDISLSASEFVPKLDFALYGLPVH